MTYNGWSNYETWLVALYMGEGYTTSSNDRETMKEEIGDYLQGVVDTDNTFINDVINSFLGEVDWYELSKDVERIEDETQTL